MKEKFVNLIKKMGNHKKIIIIFSIVAIVVIIVTVTFFMTVGREPSKYEEKINKMADALCSENEMNNVIENYIDLKAAMAWQQAEQKADKFKKEYNNIDEKNVQLDKLSDALKKYAYQNEIIYKSIKTSNIQKPEKNKSNSKIYTVALTLKYEPLNEYSYLEDSTTKQNVKVIFFNNKIIDILDERSNSLFKNVLDL